MYEIIEKNEYGVLVRKLKSIPTECEKCKYTGRTVTLQPCKSCKTDNSYYLTDKEAAKIETEKQKPLADEIISIQKEKINMLEETLKQLCDSQKELIDLQIENKQLKERIESINEYLDNRISDSDFVIKNRKRDNLEYENIMEYKQCYQNVKEFIKNQK